LLGVVSDLDDAAVYRVPAAVARGEVRDRGSRFLAVVAPAVDEGAARAVVDALAREHDDATHQCWAYRLGWPPRERSSDAGEPAGTAGAPILRALAAAGLSDAVAVVLRWFGGQKLGKGGLARAYAAATRAALAVLPVAERAPGEDLEVAVPLARVGAVKRLLRPGEVELVAEEYAPAEARLRLRLRRGRRAALAAALADLGLAPETGERVDAPRERR
jgi:putative IMPACT (imprinted ancient) family translation regulator